MASSSLFLAALVALVAAAAVLYGPALVGLISNISMESRGPSGQNRTVIVVGGGLAGMSAALEAVQNGATVILLDKEKMYDCLCLDHRCL